MTVDHKGEKQSKNLKDSVVDSPIPMNKDQSVDELRREIVELTNCFSNEMAERFAVANTSLWSNPNLCALCCLKAFFDYMMTIPVIKKAFDKRNIDENKLSSSECNVFKGVILKSFKTKDADIDIGEIYQFLNENYLKAAPILTALYKLCMTCGYASAWVECLFSTMSYVDAPRRRRMTSSRECVLPHLFFEKELVRSITFEEAEKA